MRRPPVSSGWAGAEYGVASGWIVMGEVCTTGTVRRLRLEKCWGRCPRLRETNSRTGAEVAVFYWFLKWIALGPWLRIVFRPRVTGAENVPDEGPAILASNHLSYADWLFMPLTLPRRVTFVAKAEYFTTPGSKGWFQKKFFSAPGQAPTARSGRTPARARWQTPKRSPAAGG